MDNVIVVDKLEEILNKEKNIYTETNATLMKVSDINNNIVNMNSNVAAINENYKGFWNVSPSTNNWVSFTAGSNKTTTFYVPLTGYYNVCVWSSSTHSSYIFEVISNKTYASGSTNDYGTIKQIKLVKGFYTLKNSTTSNSYCNISGKVFWDTNAANLYF